MEAILQSKFASNMGRRHIYKAKILKKEPQVKKSLMAAQTYPSRSESILCLFCSTASICE